MEVTGSLHHPPVAQEVPHSIQWCVLSWLKTRQSDRIALRCVNHSIHLSGVHISLPSAFQPETRMKYAHPQLATQRGSRSPEAGSHGGQEGSLRASKTKQGSPESGLYGGLKLGGPGTPETGTHGGQQEGLRQHQRCKSPISLLT